MVEADAEFAACVLSSPFVPFPADDVGIPQLCEAALAAADGGFGRNEDCILL